MVDLAHHPFDRGDRDLALDALLRREVLDAGVAPSSVLAWARREGGRWYVRLGAAGCDPDAIFDLASVSKPLTALVAARLVAEGSLRWDTTVADVLPALRSAAAASAPLGDLLAHRAGLPAWGALYRRDPFPDLLPGAHPSLPPDDDPSLETMLERAACRRQSPGVELYSDLGYVLAGAMVAAIGEPLSSAWARLGPSSAPSKRATVADFDDRVVPTEEVPWRGGLVRGVVHDENAWALERAGGHPGHAGAFSTAVELAHVAAAFVDALDGTSELLVPTPLARRMMEPTTGTHRIGWDTPTPGASSAGSRFGARSFGHLGFTGTSVWADPDAGAVAVLLTNRVSPSRTNLRIRAARPRVHDALWAL